MHLSIMEVVRKINKIFVSVICLAVQALDTLSNISPLCLEDYMTCQSNTRLLMLLEWCVGQGIKQHCYLF